MDHSIEITVDEDAKSRQVKRAKSLYRHPQNFQTDSNHQLWYPDQWPRIGVADHL